MAIENSFESDCRYYDNLKTVMEYYFINQLSLEDFDKLLEIGFRKFGIYFFKYRCLCDNCKSIRVRTDDFKLSKRFQRILNKNKNTRYEIKPLVFRDEYYELYKKFETERLNNADYHQLNEFLQSFFVSPTEAFIIDYYIEEKLIGYGFIDLGVDAFSSVYFVYDPDYKNMSLGIFSILNEIELAKNMGRKYYYLGYFAKGMKSHDYKTDFKPYELYALKKNIWEEGI